MFTNFSNSETKQIFNYHFSGPGRAVSPVCVRAIFFLTKQPLNYIFSMLVFLKTIQDKSQGQGHRSKFKVTGGNCCYSGQCDLEWELSCLNQLNRQLRVV